MVACGTRNLWESSIWMRARVSSITSGQSIGVFYREEKGGHQLNRIVLNFLLCCGRLDGTETPVHHFIDPRNGNRSGPDQNAPSTPQNSASKQEQDACMPMPAHYIR
ncbi:hypothetical protein ACLOJK_012809 [Asimina triloba]